MTNFKKLLIILASISLFACSEDKDRANRVPVNPNGGGVVNTDPVNGNYYTAAMLNGMSDIGLEMTLREFLTTQNLDGLSGAEIEDILFEVDLGSVRNTTNNPNEGVKVNLIFTSGTLNDISSLSADNMSLDIIIYDSLVALEGYDPFTVSFNQNSPTFVEQRMNFLNGILTLEFVDIYGTVKVIGQIVNGRFVGHIEFDNHNNDFGGRLLDLDFAI